MEVRVEFAKNYCSASKGASTLSLAKELEWKPCKQTMRKGCDVRLRTDVCLQKCTEHQENISSCRSCICNKGNGLLKKSVCRVMIWSFWMRRCLRCPGHQLPYDQNPSYSVAMTELSPAEVIPHGLPPGCFFNPLTPELNPSAQRCLARFFTGDFAS
jgi:hypothetical protein